MLLKNCPNHCDEYLIKKFCNLSDTDFGLIKTADAYRQIMNLGAVAT